MADVRVLIVDDQAPFRTAARAVVDRADGFAVVGDAETGEDAIERVAALRPDLVLMDINLPHMSGIDATRRIVDALPRTVVFLCSTYQRDDVPAAAATSGAAAYLHKEELGPAMLRALWDDAAGATRPAAAPPDARA